MKDISSIAWLFGKKISVVISFPEESGKMHQGIFILTSVLLHNNNVYISGTASWKEVSLQRASALGHKSAIGFVNEKECDRSGQWLYNPYEGYTTWRNGTCLITFKEILPDEGKTAISKSLTLVSVLDGTIHYCVAMNSQGRFLGEETVIAVNETVGRYTVTARGIFLATTMSVPSKVLLQKDL